MSAPSPFPGPRLLIKGLAVAEAPRRAGIVFEQAAAPLDGMGRQRFLDLDTLRPEPLDIAARDGGQFWALSRRQAVMLAIGIAKRRQRLRARHEGFAGALSEQIAERLRQLAKSLPQIPAPPSPLVMATTAAHAARPQPAPGGPAAGRLSLDSAARSSAARVQARRAAR